MSMDYTNRFMANNAILMRTFHSDYEFRIHESTATIIMLQFKKLRNKIMQSNIKSCTAIQLNSKL